MEEIFASHLSDRGLTSRIYKEFLILNNKTNKMGEGLEKTFSKQDIQLVDKLRAC